MTQQDLSTVQALVIAIPVLILVYILLFKKNNGALKAKRLENVHLYCFECETETSVFEKDNNFHCGECGLKH